MIKKLFIFSFVLINSMCFSQKITLKVIGLDTNAPIEKAHVFFINKTMYTNEKGEFTFNLRKKNSIQFSISHLKYYTKEIVYKKGSALKEIYLKEKKETLAEIQIKATKNLKNVIYYKKLQNLPKSVYAFGSVLNNDKIYLFGGDTSSEYEKNKEGLSEIQISNEAEIMRFLNKPKPISFNNYIGDIQLYDLNKKKWKVKKEKINNRAYHKAVVYNDTVFILGGKQLSKKKSYELLANEIENVSLTDLSVKKDKTNPHKAVDFGSAIYEDKILVFGGSTKKFDNGRIKFSDDIHFYDLKTGYWYLLTKMSKGKEVTGIVFGDKLYLFGGYNSKDLSEIESFSLKTGKWKKEGTLFRGVKKPAITKDSEYIYLQENGIITRYNPKTKNLKEYTIDLNLKGSEMHYYNDNLYIVGGYYVEDYRKGPSNGFYKVNVSEFFTTNPLRTKKLNYLN